MNKPLAGRESGITPGTIKRFGFDPAGDSLNSMKIQGRPVARPEPQPPIQPVSERFPALEVREIVFSLVAPEAASVSLAGCFNGWRARAIPLKNNGAGKWIVRLKLRSGQYEYRFIVDGRWIEDPGALQHTTNTLGGFNSIVTVPLAVETSIL